MKTWLLAVLALLLGVGCGAASVIIEMRRDRTPIASGDGSPVAAPSDVVGTPHLELEGESDFDFGVMDVGEQRKHSFIVKNSGTAPLDLVLNNKSCKCTDVLIEPATLPPGEVGQVTLEWIAADSDPEFRHGATIATTDPEHSMLQLAIHGAVQQLVRAVPAQVVFGNLTTHQPQTGQFSVYSYREKDLRVDSFDWEHAETAEFFTAVTRPLRSDELQSQPNAVGGVQVDIQVKPGLPIGEVRQAIKLHTSASSSHVLTVPVHARVLGDVNIAGRGYRSAQNLLLLGAVKRDAGKRARLMMLVKGPHREDFTARVVRTTPAGVLHAEIGQASSLKGGAIRKVPLDVWIAPGAPPVSYLGTKADDEASIVLETSHPDVPQLEIRVRFATIE